MGDPNYGYPQGGYPPQNGGGNVATKVTILMGAVIALVLANVYLYFQLDNTKQDLAKVHESLEKNVASIRESTAVQQQAQRRTVDSLRDQLEAAQRQASMAAGQAKIDATKRAEELAAKLAAEQEKQKAAVAAEFSNVKQQTAAVAAEAASKIGEVKTDVSKVDTKLESTKSELEKTIANLNRVTGDLGVQSGLIATNSKELSALRALGERNYFEFNLGKTKQPQRVGDITLLLKKADQKKNRYTVEITADDKRTEKKDKSVNEPVQFYVAAARQPYEIVVNEVGKDVIKGYLATPKVREPRK
jgi:tetrahydromethanopterin S-methyltransferase subunit G